MSRGPRREARNCEITREVLRLAKLRTGWTWERIGIEIGMYNGREERAKIEARVRFVRGELLNFEAFLAVCKLAGFPRAYSVVLWAQASIPDDRRDLRRFVGLALQGFKSKTWISREDAKKYLEDRIKVKARIMPDTPEQYRPGDPLKRPTVKF